MKAFWLGVTITPACALGCVLEMMGGMPARPLTYAVRRALVSRRQLEDTGGTVAKASYYLGQGVSIMAAFGLAILGAQELASKMGSLN